MHACMHECMHACILILPRCMKLQMMQTGGLQEFQRSSSFKGSLRQVDESHPFSQYLVWRHISLELIGYMLLMQVWEQTLLAMFLKPCCTSFQDTIKARCQALNEELQMFYRRNDTEDRLKNFSHLSFKRPKPTQPAKLKGSAAQVRAVIPFVQKLTEKLCDDSVLHEAAIKLAAKHLAHCYQALAQSSAPCRDEALYHSSQAFALQFHALHLAGHGVS